MALFQVPGWSVPAATLSTSQSSRKRKRPSASDHDKLQSAAVNLDKLMKKLDDGDDDGDTGRGAPNKAKKLQDTRKSKIRDGKGKHVRTKDGDRRVKHDSGFDASTGSKEPASSLSARSKKTKKKRSNGPEESGLAVTTSNLGSSVEVPGLTAMQQGMKQSLDGARFRWINEVLYKSDSAQAHQMMQADPKVYEEYHTGFRHQVHSWPTNPVSHYIETLSSYPSKTVIADLGCGDAALARALIPKEMVVLSFDLVSDGTFVIEADTCGTLPLPGSLGHENEVSEGTGQVVDVVVCALSLMGTNWVNCVREAWRVLKPGGELKIAEVASRFTDVDDFALLVSSVGFRLRSKDDRNTHFTLFEFKKSSRKGKTQKEWESLVSRGSTLKPCEYKRR